MTVIATAGHVDHGKSSLVRALTGTDPDRWEEEKRRGMTIDLGFASTVLPSGAIASFIDVPGHIRFLRNMLAGVGAIDACVLVVDAREGWMPQTEEHFQILKLLGVACGVVALTKIDLIDEALENIRRREIVEHTSGSFLANSEIIATSVNTQVGLDKFRTALDELVASDPLKNNLIARHRPRLWIDRSFTAKGAGTVVTGTLIDGSLHVGDELVVVRTQQTVRIREIQQHEKAITTLDDGNRCALNLVGISHEEISRGDALVNVKQWKPTAMFDASLRIVPSLKHRVTRRGSYSVYIGAGEFFAKIRLIGVRELNADEQGCVRIAIDSSLALKPGDRYILRESGRQETIGGGEVLDIHPILRVSRAKPDRSLERLIAEHGWITVNDFELLTAQRLPAVVGEWLTTPELYDTLRKDLALQLSKNPDGIEVSRLKTHEQAVIATLPEVVIEMGRARIKGANSISDHPYAGLFAHAGVTPPDTKNLDRNIVRQLVHRGLLVDVDGTVFHITAIETARLNVIEILNQSPNGFTVSQFREYLGITRKHAVPLLEALDSRGITKRLDDLRVGGARLV
ncbi:MAG: selenocysteine-specific translation elongation factor, partial [Actinobacteria bacterium]|nr:selenocysteine-specific translation elongation factor [Actinomycetota bacterium]